MPGYREDRGYYKNMVSILPLTIGYLLDLIIGDPHSLPHPITYIGKLIKKCETLLRRRENFLKIKGVVLFFIVTGLSFGIIWLLIYLTGLIHHFLGLIVQLWLIFQILATKSLYIESLKVQRALESGDIKEARKYLSWLVTRDCSQMSKQDIIRSTVETISENITDGITAPLFYITLGGAPLGMLYKAVNTLDSMVGYKNERYKDFGYFSAKMDDIFNYIPARITALFIILSCFFLGLDSKRAFFTLLRDRKKHDSPNSPFGEAPVAGALGIYLGGRVTYFDKIYDKPKIGDGLKEPDIEDIEKCHRIMFLTSLLFYLFCVGVLYVLR